MCQNWQFILATFYHHPAVQVLKREHERASASQLLVSGVAEKLIELITLYSIYMVMTQGFLNLCSGSQKEFSLGFWPGFITGQGNLGHECAHTLGFSKYFS